MADTTPRDIPAFRLVIGQTFTLPPFLGGGTYVAQSRPTGEFNTYIDATGADGNLHHLYIRDGISVTVDA